MIRFNKLYVILFLAAVIAGCQKFVDVPLPISQLNTEAAFATNEKANSSMRGIYAQMLSTWATGPFTGALTTNLGLSSDELEKTSLSGDHQFFFENNLNANVGANTSGFWNALYASIYQANNAYINVEKSTGVTPATKDQLMGEARFLRALFYFYLVNLYDSVPLALTPDYRVNALLPREAPGKIWDQIKEDLVYAQEKSGTAHTAAGFRARGNKWSSTALLARVQLYQKNWVEAEKQATAVIDAGIFQLDALENVFLATSTESILQFGNSGANIYTSEGGAVTGNPAAANPNYRFSTYLDASFEAGDQRKIKWSRTGANGFAGPAKYKTVSNSQAGAKEEGIVILRLAEQYLIRAEARAMQDNLGGAIADVDTIRSRAGLPLLSDTNPGIGKDALLQAIMKERFTELFAELGHRWFDIKRTGQADVIFGARKPGWRKEAALFPIPFSERQKNPNLTQNPGYE